MATLVHPTVTQPAHGSTQSDVPRNPDFDKFRKVKHIDQNGQPVICVINVNQSPWPEVVRAMRADEQDVGAVAIRDNKNIPAGFTYLGQLLAHDISYNRMIGNDTPMLRLQSLYGGGPATTPYLYAHYRSDMDDPAMRALHMRASENYNRFRHVKLMLRHVGGNQYDVLRHESNSISFMADTRNDQNFLINQLHCAFIRFHNAMAEWLNFQSRERMKTDVEAREWLGEELFRKTREIVVWCYHRIIVDEYLKLMVHDPTLIDKLKSYRQLGFKLFDHTMEPRLMPEFALAAMRVGHSQVQDVYMLTLGKERRRIFEPDARSTSSDPMPDLRGFKKYRYVNIDWPLFFNIGGDTAQPSSAIDHRIAAPMYDLIFIPRGQGDLPKINLNQSGRLPSGNWLAEQLQKASEETAPSAQKSAVRRKSFLESAKVRLPELFGKENKGNHQKGIAPNIENTDVPLWLYILLEADIEQKGQSLGALGSQIFAEQFMWILRHEPTAFMDEKQFQNYLEAKWGEEMSRAGRSQAKEAATQLAVGAISIIGKEFKMADLIAFPETVNNTITFP